MASNKNNNYTGTRWFFVVPLLSIVCTVYLIYLFKNVAEEQDQLLETFSKNELRKSESLRELYAQYADNHVELFNLLAQASAGLDEGDVYDIGIGLLDELDENAERFDKFSDLYTLSDNERFIYNELLEHLTAYYEVSHRGIEMTTVNLALSNDSVRSANNYFKAVSQHFSELTSAMHKNNRLSFLRLQNSTDGYFRSFFVITLIILLLISGISSITALAHKKLRYSLKKLNDERRNSENIITSMADILIVTSMDGVIKKVNEAACQFFQREPKNLIEKPLSQFVQQGERLIKTLLHLDKQCAGKASKIETNFLLGRNKRIPVSISGAVMRDSHEREYGLVFVAKDITERMEAERQLQFLANHDSLTDLPNRVKLLERLEKSLIRSERYLEKTAVLFLDLDQFKIVNDILGHDVGDELLKDFAGRLSSCMRKGDVVARIGGDEFIVVLNGVNSQFDIIRTTERIFNSLKEPFVLDQNTYTATASIGISVYPDDAVDTNTLLKHADTAMYQAKSQGRNNFRFYTAEMNKHAVEQFELEADLRQALDNNEFELYYQPQVSVADGKIVGAESLLRWNSPKRGIVLPGKFLGAANESGLILPIEKWVLETACLQAQDWRNRGLADIRIAVNLGDKQFHNPDLIEVVSRALDRSRLDPGFLELELTENILMYNAESIIKKMKDLKALGIKLSIDDFGTGYSSYSQLKHFAIDVIKIDKTFVDELPDNADDKAIVNAIIAMSKSLNLTIVAEGVETERQLAYLTQAGCDVIQGYVYSKPMPAFEFEKILRLYNDKSLKPLDAQPLSDAATKL